MNLENALQNIRRCRESMDTLYQRPVFDEWLVVAMENKGPQLLSYEGPRAETFLKTFHADSVPLAREMQSRNYEVGDFEFAQDGKGSRFDGCVRIGEHTYIFCNNTYGTMTDLRQDRRWLKAQKPLLDLTEKFRADPLV